MCHLLTDCSVEVQKMAYQLLHEAAKKRTEYLVIETGVDNDGTIEAQLPTELIDILQQTVNQDGPEHNENVSSSKMLSVEQNSNFALEYSRIYGWLAACFRPFYGRGEHSP
jgi:hypothetical protein